jgi:hypothetical protein
MDRPSLPAVLWLLKQAEAKVCVSKSKNGSFLSMAIRARVKRDAARGMNEIFHKKLSWRQQKQDRDQNARTIVMRDPEILLIEME